MELVTGYGGKAHITPENWADLNRGFSGMESYVTETGRKFEAELISNNLLKIHDGCGIMQGRQVVIPKGQSDEVTIQNGTQGMKRIDLVVERYTKNPDTKIETTETVLIKGTPSTNPTVPAYTVGDIRSGDMKADWPLYEVELNGINVVEVRPVFKTLVNMSEIQEMLTELNSKSYEIIKSSNGYVKKYADGRFEAYVRTTIQNVFNFTQIGNSGIYYASFSNVAIGITAGEVTSIITNAANNGVIWSGNAYLNNNNQAVNGMVFQYGLDKTRPTTVMIEVKGRWK
nr:MAG TPA: hypothetical protein [Caudoviricetes sp.]